MLLFLLTCSRLSQDRGVTGFRVNAHSSQSWHAPPAEWPACRCESSPFPSRKPHGSHSSPQSGAKIETFNNHKNALILMMPTVHTYTNMDSVTCSFHGDYVFSRQQFCNTGTCSCCLNRSSSSSRRCSACRISASAACCAFSRSSSAPSSLCC